MLGPEKKQNALFQGWQRQELAFNFKARSSLHASVVFPLGQTCFGFQGYISYMSGAICTHLHMIDSMWRVVVVTLSVKRYMF